MSSRALPSRGPGHCLVAPLTAVLLLFTISGAFAQTNWRFSQQAAIPMGAAPTSLLITDLTGDGLADLVVANPDSDTITVRVAAPDHTFGAPVIFDVGDLPQPIAVGDLDRDGFVDLVVGLRGPASVYGLSLLLGTGDANLFRRLPDQLLQAPIPFPTVVRQVALADYSGDGFLDVLVGAEAILSPTSRSQQIYIYQGFGDRVAPPPWRLVGGVPGTGPGDSPAVGTVDRNVVPGHEGVAVAIGGSAQQIRFTSLSNQGGGFNFPKAGLTGLAPADFNGDGLFDLASSHHTTEAGTGGIYLAYSAGVNELRRIQELTEGDYIALASSDMNGDGTLDIVALRPTGIVAILQSGALVGFEAAGVDVDAPATSLAVSDLNADGRPDLAVTTAAGVVVLLQRAPISPVLLDTLEAQVSDLQAQIEGKDATILDLRRQVDDLAAANLELQDLIDTLTEEKGKLTAANTALTEENATLAAANTALTDDNGRLAAANAALTSELAAADATIADLQEQLANAGAPLARLNNLIDELQQALRMARRDPSFTIPGATAEDRIRNVLNAIGALNRGQQLALYRALGGQK